LAAQQACRVRQVFTAAVTVCVSFNDG
jgi:hypothetical protein